MTVSITFEELRKMTPEERDRALSQIIEATRNPSPNGARRKLDAGIRAFEERWGIDSAELRRRVSVGEQEETDEVLEWLMLLNRRDVIESLKALPR